MYELALQHLMSLMMTPIEPRATDGLEDRSKTPNWIAGLAFVMAMWFLSRLVIIVAMQLIAPLQAISPVKHSDPLPLDFLPGFVPQSSWELFSHWDGAWYRKIVTSGYEYLNDGKFHAIAFFPLFPLVIRGVMALGLPFNVAGTIVNNLSFLGALFVLYRWTQQRYGIWEARWLTAIVAWCPFSLFGTVIYSEGLFLLLTTAALQAFDNHQYTKAALWGTLATATRATGIALLPAFLLVAVKEQRLLLAYLAGLAVSTGLLLFSLYCGIRFGDFLAFVRVQQAWAEFHPSWFTVWARALTGSKENLMRVVMFFGGGYGLWLCRAKLPAVATAYGFCSLAIIQATGSLSSVSRYVYGIVSITMALGLLCARYPRWGYATLGLFAIVLTQVAIKFAWWYWIA